MSACAVPGRIERHHSDTLVRPSDCAPEDDRRRSRQMPAQAFERVAELPRPRPRHRIIKRDDETRARRRIEPSFDQLPRLEIVRERQCAKIMAERRADPRCDREHGGDSRHDGQVELAPALRSGFDGFADRGRHGEDAGIAAGDDGHARALRGVTERGGGARLLLSVLGRVALLPGALRHAVEIWRIAVKRLRGTKRILGLGGQVARVAGSEADDGEVSVHGRSSQPGTNTTAKYGASSSALAASGIMTASAIVPRST